MVVGLQFLVLKKMRKVHSLQLDENGNVRVAISPNEDGNKDLVEYKTVALRNIENLRATVYAASDTEHKIHCGKELPSDHRKNFFNGDQKNPRSYTLDNTAWNGIDANGKAVADGLYDYVIRYTPMVPGAERAINDL